MTIDLTIKPLLEQKLLQPEFSSLCEPLSHYLFLLNKWNSAYNLTAVRSLESMVSKHLLDSLAIVPFLAGTRVLDVGSGAGLPGIPLALAKPETQFVLLDSNGKKIRFLQEVKRQLGLKNVEIVQNRAENYQPVQSFDTLTSRAFSSLEQLIHWTQHLISEKGIWLAMKGRYPDTELSMITKNWRVEQYSVEDVAGERCCVIIEN